MLDAGLQILIKSDNNNAEACEAPKLCVCNEAKHWYCSTTAAHMFLRRLQCE